MNNENQEEEMSVKDWVLGIFILALAIIGGSYIFFQSFVVFEVLADTADSLEWVQEQRKNQDQNRYEYTRIYMCMGNVIHISTSTNQVSSITNPTFEDFRNCMIR